MINHTRISTRMLILLFVVSVFATSCARNGKSWIPFLQEKSATTPAPVATTTEPPPDAIGAQPAGAAVSLPLTDEAGIPVAEPLRMNPNGGVPALQTVYFDYDSAALSDSTLAALDGNATWIAANPGVQISVEGHCDERGTVEYNYNLGQQRADVAREHLAAQGVDASTLHTISYGEDRPVETGHDETAWAKNRRVQFLVY